MGRPKKNAPKDVPVQVRLDARQAAALDEIVAEFQAVSPAEVSRASVLRHLLEREIEARAKPRKATKR
jgi:hypothetical protein